MAEETQEKASCCWQWLSDHTYLVGGIIVLLVILKLTYKDLRHRWFAAFCSYFTKGIDAKMQEMKKDIFATLGSVVSHDPALRKIGALKILEIGVGTGTNFVHYPKGSRLTVVDPNPHFEKYYAENRKKFPNIHADNIIVSTGEEMDMVPSNSADVVVVTLVFCSVNDTEKVLKQILRVLVPGGKFYFYEHVLEFDAKNHGLRKKIQQFLTVTNFWPFFFDNCQLNRDMTNTLKSTGFSKVKSEYFYAPITHPLFWCVKPSIKGVAEKAGGIKRKN